MAAPTFVSYGASAFNSTTTPKTVSVTTQTGDRLLVIAYVESGSLPTTTAPTGNSNTFTQIDNYPSSNDNTVGRHIAWSCTEASGTTYNVSCSRPSSDTAVWWGCEVWIYRDSDGFGAVATATSAGTASVTITTTQANSAVCMGGVDWNAVDGASRTAQTVNSSTGTEGTYFRDSTRYTVYTRRWDDVGSAASKTVGYSAPSGQKFAGVAVEIKGTSAVAPPQIVIPSRPWQYNF